MKTFLLRFFTWWNGQTFGTQVWTGSMANSSAADEFGNRYYRTKGGKIDPVARLRAALGDLQRRRRSLDRSRRRGMAGCTTRSMCRRRRKRVEPRPWWKPHRPNLTGTPGAQRPTGSTLAQGRRPRATGDYKPWTPGR